MHHHPAQFTIISAVYNVRRYLTDFLPSLDAQDYDHRNLRVILIDDGSTDGSLEAIKDWATTTDIAVTVLSQPNAGQASARNHGLDLLRDVTGWVTFTDPDDFIDRDYFSRISAFIDGHPSVELVSTHQQDYVDDGRTKQWDWHPLRFRFDGHDQLVDIDRFPRFIQLHASSTIFRISHINNLSLRFDPDLRPVFEDGHFVIHYLLRRPQRLVGFLSSANYHYRRRSDNSSTLQSSDADWRRYTTVLERGHLDLLRTASSISATIPEWLQNSVIYDLSWIFKHDERIFSASAGLPQTVCDEFHRLLREIRPYLADHVIENFRLLPLPMHQREALKHGTVDRDWHWPEIFVDKLDSARHLVRLRYRYTGKRPIEEIYVRGRSVTLHYSKTRDFVYLGHSLSHERYLWVWADGDLAVKLNGSAVPLTFHWPEPRRYSLLARNVRRARHDKSAPNAAKHKRLRHKSRDRRALKLTVAQAIARTVIARKLFGDAWLLMDRDSQAHDNAEHLFRHMRKHRREINAWFTVTKSSSDWTRLKRLGLKRLIPYGSILWYVACLNATHMISSQASRYVYEPFRKTTGKWTWKFIFLQHGVTKDDISRWLNPKPIAGFVTATRPEFESIAGDHSPYVFSTKETVLTGFPRHDRLAQLAAKTTPETILIMPTWREYLLGPSVGMGENRTLVDSFMSTPFAQAWQEVLSSRTLANIARENNLRVVFMPHPNLHGYVKEFNLDDHIEIATYDKNDVQEELARAALVVTDYSSIAFDAAAIRRPVIYFQFDRGQIFNGTHVTRAGYFDYGRDGFGPVCETIIDLETALPLMVASPGRLQDPYADRVEATFTVPLSGACDRVVDFIVSMEKPVARPKAVRATRNTDSLPMGSDIASRRDTVIDA